MASGGALSKGNTSGAETGPGEATAGATPARKPGVLAVAQPDDWRRLERIEWLLTDGSGGYAMGSAAGIPGRRYHGWLIPACTPPVGRAVYLAGAVETVVLEAGTARESRHELSSLRFPVDVVHPGGAKGGPKCGLAGFAATATGVRWEYRFPSSRGELLVTRELCLLHHELLGNGQSGEHAAAIIRYGVGDVGGGVRLEIRPLVSMRDFHALARGRWPDGDPERLKASDASGVVTITNSAMARLPELHMACDQGSFAGGAGWWRDVEYLADMRRGQEFREDLFIPGVFTVEIPPAPDEESHVELAAWIGARPGLNFEQAASRHRERTERLVARTVQNSHHVKTPELTTLVRAADQFVVRRTQGGDAAGGMSIIAGYPWFSDWGRDTMISLPGLLIATGRLDDARRVLATWAGMRRNGLIPNCFDNGSGTPEYNTVDASLWFVHAACAFARAAADRTFAGGLLGTACLDVVEAYRHGTEYGIRMDPSDGLIAAGDQSTQLTWMDARRNGVIFTPRAGKAIEINALWYSVLLELSGVLADARPRTARELAQLAAKCGESIRSGFYDRVRRCCYDLLPGSTGAPPGQRPWLQLRPNQIFAVSLPHSALEGTQQEAVIDTVRRRLLTPVGLRTLDPLDPAYRGRYEGDLFQRDGAYHNGTVWPWLLGPFAEALMRRNAFSETSKVAAAEVLRPLIGQMLTAGEDRCIAQLSEVYDGDDAPERARHADGCPAQAWSVAETLRVWLMATA